MKGRSFVLSALILALGGFFAKAIGAVYKIPLTNILGSSGMGLYYLVFPVYSLIITICSSGLSVALSIEVAKCRKIRHRYNEQKLLRVCLVLSFLLSLFFTIVVLLVGRPLAEFQGNINASLGYISIAPAIILSSIIATLRGYFQGVENMVPTTVSMIVEQIVKLSSGLILAHALCNFGIQYAVLGAIIGVTISEVVALIIISINFFTFKGQLFYNYRNLHYRGKKKYNTRPILKRKIHTKSLLKNFESCHYFKANSNQVRYTTKVAIKKILKIAFPNTLSSIILPIITMLDSFLIINLLISSGYSSFVSTSLYGLYGGVVQSLISLPIILIAGVSTSIVPSLSGVVECENRGAVGKRITFFIKLTWALGLLMFMLFFVFAEDILYFLYGDGLSRDVIDELYYATEMLKLSSVSIIYYAFLQTFTAILQSIGKSMVPLFAMLISFCVRFLLLIVLVTRVNINIFGVIIANTLFLGLTICILAIFIRKYTELNFDSWHKVFFPIIPSLVSLILMKICHMGLCYIMNYFFSMLFSAILGCSVFIIWLYFSRFFTLKEKKHFNLRKQKLTKTKSS
ncbi:MAG: polysaccharide biosynthesis protein [Clostridia bacterium]|nr:polysaccharide biosynthesis protein [Clostridia bacterium]